MTLPCQRAIQKFSKYSIVTKYTIIFSFITFLISIIITLTVLYYNRENFELTFVSRAHCFTNSLKFTILHSNNSKLENILKDVEKRGSILYVKTEIKENFNCKISNPKHVINFIPENQNLKFYKTCFKYNNLSLINYFSPKYYQNRLWHIEKKIFILFVLGFLIFILLVYATFKKLLSPIVCLSTTMKNVKLGENCEFINDSQFDKYLSANSRDEISNLIFSYCDMINRLNNLQKESLELQELVNKTRKFATIGELVSGIAHEINNPLAGINNCLYNLKKDLPKEKKEKYIYLSQQAVKLIEELMNNLLNFSAAPTSCKTGVNIKTVILESVEFLKAKIENNNIDIQLNLIDNINIISNKYSLMQIFLNLLLNSISALKDKNNENKLIKITTTEDEKFINISFWDNGTGIRKDLQDKIFEPFFTTKKGEKGNGLGLFIVSGIISALNYSIEVKSEEGKWTEFIIKILKEKK